MVIGCNRVIQDSTLSRIDSILKVSIIRIVRIADPSEGKKYVRRLKLDLVGRLLMLAGWLISKRPKGYMELYWQRIIKHQERLERDWIDGERNKGTGDFVGGEW